MPRGGYQVFGATECGRKFPQLRSLLCYAILFNLMAGCAAAGSTAGPSIPAGSPTSRTGRPGPIGADKTQLLTVISDGWNTFHGELRRYQRQPGAEWVQIDAPIPVVLGRAGYGWGRGLHGDGAPEGQRGPIKREGDGRSPAGVFEVGPIYGYEPPSAQVSLVYVEATSSLRCVDDPTSVAYNRIVSVSDTVEDWSSAELMRRQDDHYEIAIFVGHNANPPMPDAGSCIFLHVWEGPDVAVRGCTAMAKPALETLSRWLEPEAAVLVALPQDTYDELVNVWDLPMRP